MHQQHALALTSYETQNRLAPKTGALGPDLPPLSMTQYDLAKGRFHAREAAALADSGPQQQPGITGSSERRVDECL